MAWGTEGTPAWLPLTWQARGQSRREQRPVCLQANWKTSVLVVFLSLCLSLGWKGKCWSSSLQTRSRQEPIPETYLPVILYYPWQFWKGLKLICLNCFKNHWRRNSLQTHHLKVDPTISIFWVVYFLNSNSHTLCPNFFLPLMGRRAAYFIIMRKCFPLTPKPI